MLFAPLHCIAWTKSVSYCTKSCNSLNLSSCSENSTYVNSLMTCRFSQLLIRPSEDAVGFDHNNRSDSIELRRMQPSSHLAVNQYSGLISYVFIRSADIFIGFCTTTSNSWICAQRYLGPIQASYRLAYNGWCVSFKTQFHLNSTGSTCSNDALARIELRGDLYYANCWVQPSGVATVQRGYRPVTIIIDHIIVHAIQPDKKMRLSRATIMGAMD